MKRFFIFLTLIASLNADDVTSPLKAKFNALGATDCYCNNEAGVSLINKSRLIPADEKINEEISQMIVDAKNELYYIEEYWTKGLAAEASQFAPDRNFYTNLIYEDQKTKFENEKKIKKKCLMLEISLNAINNDIINAELELLKLKKQGN